jgi:multiple sugar transport system ATP-binding protein
MVFQSYALYPHMSVYDNMAFGLKLRKTPKDEIDRRVKESAEMLAIGHLLDRKPRPLRAVNANVSPWAAPLCVTQPFFLMDEPLSNLDAKLRVQTRAEISKLHQRLKTTFIYVTHDQTEAMTMGTRIAVMKDGVLQQLDTPQNFYDNPANMFVAGFIGSPSMNFFEATVGRGNGGLVVDIGPFNLPVPASHAAKLDAHVGKQVYFGIRPENIHDAHYVPRGVEENAVMKANVTVREPLGSEVYAFVENGGKEMVSRLDPRTSAAIGQGIDLVVDMSKLHVFDRDSEKAII